MAERPTQNLNLLDPADREQLTALKKKSRHGRQKGIHPSNLLILPAAAFIISTFASYSVNNPSEVFPEVFSNKNRELTGEIKPPFITQEQTDSTKSNTCKQNLDSGTAEKLNYAKAFENIQRTFFWMKSQEDVYIRNTPERITTSLWSTQRLSENQYVSVAFIPINADNTLDIKVLVSTDKFDDEMSESDIKEAARQFFYARFLVQVAQSDPKRFICNPTEVQQEVYQMPFILPLAAQR